MQGKAMQWPNRSVGEECLSRREGGGVGKQCYLIEGLGEEEGACNKFPFCLEFSDEKPSS